MSDRRAQIEARLEAATPGPWRVNRYDHGGGRAHIEEPRRTLIADFYREGDREMLAHAPADLRWLLDALSAAEAERDALAATVGRVRALADEWEKNLALWGKQPSPEALVITLADLRGALEGR